MQPFTNNGYVYVWVKNLEWDEKHQTNKNKAPTNFTKFINTGNHNAYTSVSYADLEAMLRADFF